MIKQTVGQTTQKFLVIDDHELVLNATVNALQQAYPAAEISTAQNAYDAGQLVAMLHPDLVLMDLSMPKTAVDLEGGRPEVGIQLLRSLLESYPTLNIVVQSAYAKALVRLKPMINAHEAGFTIADKSLPLKDMLTKVDWALQGLVCTPKEMRTGLELKPEWLEVLKLACEQGLQDKAIAEKMNVSERTVRHYWTQVQDALGVYPETGKNIRIQTEKRAREEGLID
ncbi:response regulator transcription factor [Leptolyngbya sp. NK1-12]|uniref:Response regulator transcription factor n=1 Tax=Leptolyngbya sp. NK1-12 TaxID=2547451 RepID=A0AA96WM17_9CYAN|nr:response regulator transcription factor [Leptolyngbya sp. NK1-12]MBF2048629.1 response regulator transcription factor [Elainella sp. C42_A2020_010]RNJ68495.1 MAG: DNA-binding response regulator [Leptolyngbya sp. IPPAS B-1204]WNZ27155.1 response regulator transcription factor [Leptolyngbya sp. NK1-12]